MGTGMGGMNMGGQGGLNDLIESVTGMGGMGMAMSGMSGPPNPSDLDKEIVITYEQAYKGLLSCRNAVDILQEAHASVLNVEKEDVMDDCGSPGGMSGDRTMGEGMMGGMGRPTMGEQGMTMGGEG